MGKNDVVSRNYFKENARFADFFNLMLFGGDAIIKPEDIAERDSVLTAVLRSGIYGEDGERNKGRKPKRENKVKKGKKTTKGKDIGASAYFRERDVLRMATVRGSGIGANLILLGCENNDYINFAAPVKAMLYDALGYIAQVDARRQEHKANRDYGNASEYMSGFRRDDRLVPIITAFIYWGDEEWVTPHRLGDLMELVGMDARMASRVNDYPIYVVQPRHLPDDELRRLKSDLRAVFGFMKHKDNESELDKLIEREGGLLSNMEADAAELISTYARVEIEADMVTEGGRVNMCKGIEDMKKSNLNKGRNEGWGLGENSIITLIGKLTEDGKLDVITRLPKMTVAERRELYRKYGVEQLPEA